MPGDLIQIPLLHPRNDRDRLRHRPHQPLDQLLGFKIILHEMKAIPRTLASPRMGSWILASVRFLDTRAPSFSLCQRNGVHPAWGRRRPSVTRGLTIRTQWVTTILTD